MALSLITADQRLHDRNLKVSMAIFGIWGVGKTSLLKTLDPETTFFLNFESGDKSVQTWLGDEMQLRSFEETLDIACLIGGGDPSLPPHEPLSMAHYEHVVALFGNHFDIGRYKTIFADSITDLSRLSMTWAKKQPEAFSDKKKNPDGSAVPDIRGAYGLHGRACVNLLRHLQHSPGKNIIFVGILEEIKDDFDRVTWQPQMEGGKLGRELPGIVDEVVTMAYMDYDPAADSEAKRWNHAPGKGEHRVLVCRSPNPWSLPAKDRSGNLDLIEEPDLGKLIEKINKPARTAAENRQLPRPEITAAA